MLLLASLLHAGCAFVGEPEHVNSYGLADDDDDGGTPTPQGTYRSWSWNSNGNDVNDAPPSDFFRFMADGGWLEFDGVVFDDGWIDASDRFYVDGQDAGDVVPVLSVADTVIAGLIANDGRFLDLHWEDETQTTLIVSNTGVTPVYP